MYHPDKYVRACVEAAGADPHATLEKAAIDLHGAGFGSKSKAAITAWQLIGSCMVAINGAPLAFKGPMNPDGPDYPHRETA